MKLVNLTCPNCSGAMKKEGENIVCQSCGAVFAIDYDDADVEHEKLQTEDERAKREFEHEKELLEIRHRQEEEARIAAEKRESKRAVKAKIGRSISAKISGLIGLLIVVGFFYGSYKLCVRWGVVPPMKEIIASATANNAPNYNVPVEAITDEVLENMISAGRSTKLSTRSNRNIKDYANGEWIEYTLSEVELDSAYFIDNASEGHNRVVIIFKLTNSSSTGDKITYDAVFFDELKISGTDGSLVCNYIPENISRSKAAWHNDSYEDRDQCYRENVLAFGGTVTELGI